MKKYYLDTSIWRDYCENRSDKFRPLGDWALRLLNQIDSEGDKIIVSEIIIIELEKRFKKEEINNIFEPFKKAFIYVNISEKQRKEMRLLNNILKIGKGDILHAILARDNEAIMVTRDKHFDRLSFIVEPFKPEDLI